ncbi:unnamed protein product [Parajaminaea phylloscopi]
MDSLRSAILRYILFALVYGMLAARMSAAICCNEVAKPLPGQQPLPPVCLHYPGNKCKPNQTPVECPC